MKLNELITEFDIYMTNEERSLYEELDDIVPLLQFNEHQRLILNNLIRKSLVSKVRHNNQIAVARNEI